MLEMWWPPGYFDLMTHLIIHLVYELKICGPMASIWCYPIEKYLYVLNQYVKNKAKPKGCMYNEMLGFAPNTLHYIRT
jgi:hypothetical protein